MTGALVTAAEIATWTGATIVAGPPDRAIDGATIDSRTASAGELFFAIRGERFDGHDFAQAAAAAGACGVVVEPARAPEIRSALAANGNAALVLAVDDPRRALGRWARAWRRRWAGRVAAITGSNGKTTTKDLTASILAAAYGEDCVLATRGNLNNDLGVPLTLLRLRPQHRVAVIEMGMSALGEIAHLASIAQPDVGLVTNVGTSHLEKLGSVDAVARAKGELYAHLATAGTAIVPLGDARLEQQAASIPRERQVWVSYDAATGRAADVAVLDAAPRGAGGLALTLQYARERLEGMTLPLVGLHNARNAAAAAGVALALGVASTAVRRGFAAARSARHRSEVLSIAARTVLADCYNSSPASTRAALDTLASLIPGGRRVAVLGDMLELGPEGPRLHAEVGAHAHQIGLDLLICVGPLARHIAAGAREAGMPGSRIVETDDRSEAARAALATAGPGDGILVKASRGMRLEAVLEALGAETTRQGGGEG